MSIAFENTVYFPAGTIMPFAGSSIPTGWVMCDGSSYDGTNSTYATLWQVIGVTYGGSSQSSFKVPNLGNRVPVGVKTTTNSTPLDGSIGKWTGATEVLLSSSTTGVNHSHSVDESAVSGHTPTYTSGGHSHRYKLKQWVSTANGGGGAWGTAKGNATYNHWSGASTYGTTNNNTNVTLSAASVGAITVNNSTAVSNASSAHSNNQPQLFLHYIIKL